MTWSQTTPFSIWTVGSADALTVVGVSGCSGSPGAESAWAGIPTAVTIRAATAKDETIPRLMVMVMLTASSPSAARRSPVIRVQTGP
ncbi:hypothetical protein CPER28S_02591 [Cellulomonas persica]